MKKFFFTLALTGALTIAAHAETVAIGSGVFSMGADSKTGKTNRCGLELRVVELTSASKTAPTMKQISMVGMIGSIYLNLGDKGGTYGTTKMAAFLKKTAETEPTIKPVNTWWIKPDKEPAAVATGKIIPADNKPYKLAGMSTDDALRVFSAVIENKSITWYFEPTIEGGAVNISAKLEVERDEQEKLLNCLTEMLK